MLAPPVSPTISFSLGGESTGLGRGEAGVMLAPPREHLHPMRLELGGK